MPGQAAERTVGGHAFICYVREDAPRVSQLQKALESAGVRVWRDTDELWPGADWRSEIRRAITENALVFVACFSRHSAARGASYQNEELNLAVEQTRRRRPGEPWLIPVRFDDCEIPDLDIGAGRTLQSIQRADLFGARAEQDMGKLTAAILGILRSPAASATAGIADTGFAEIIPSEVAEGSGPEYAAASAGAGREGILLLALDAAVAGLSRDDALTIIELTDPGLVRWEMRLDQAGTPRCFFSPPLPWRSFYQDSSLAENTLSQLIPADRSSHVLIVNGSPDSTPAAAAFAWLRSARPQIPSFGSKRLAETLRDALANSALTCRYDLVLVNRTPSGRLQLCTSSLFPAGARRGDLTALKIRCEPSGGQGTAFAVIASQEPARGFQLVSVQSADPLPGSYVLTAELRRPGAVRFHGLPVPLRQETQTWSGLTAALPERFYPATAIHLICLVEISGGSAQVNQRLTLLEQLTSFAAAQNNQLKVSLATYGQHHLDSRRLDDMPTMTWAQGIEAAHAALANARSQITGTVPAAAAIECALTETARRLTSQPGRPVLLTVGASPPYPSRAGHAAATPPCPSRSDWSSALEQLRRYSGILLGAIRDDGPEHEIWNQLGRDAFTHLNTVNAHRFAASLDLVIPADQAIPFPFLEPAGH